MHTSTALLVALLGLTACGADAVRPSGAPPPRTPPATPAANPAEPAPAAPAEPTPAPPAEPTATGLKFLLFQTGVMLPMIGSMPGPMVIDTEGVAEQVDAVLAGVHGERGDGVHWQLGFSMGPLAFDLTDAQLETIIDVGFAIAQDRGVAVGFHIDDSMFWNRRSDLWQSSENVEWSDWDGTVVPHRIIGWAGNSAPILAPPMCFKSPAIAAEATRLARDVIGAAVKRNVDRLEAAGVGHLFAGVIAGWETRMQDDTHDPAVPYGYCALHHAGYSREHPPENGDIALVGIVSDWVSLWTASLAAAGVPRERIFTHIAVGDPPSQPMPNLLRDYYKDSPPAVTAFTNSSRPGFSVYGQANLAAVYEALAMHPEQPWGISEGTAVDLMEAAAQGTDAVPPDGMERYLARAYNHGATYVNLFGWSDGDSAFAKATASDSARRTYEKLLRGEPLGE